MVNKSALFQILFVLGFFSNLSQSSTLSHVKNCDSLIQQVDSEKAEFLGEGSSGRAYKVVLEDGTEVVIKYYKDPKKLKRDYELLNLARKNQGPESLQVPATEILSPKHLLIEYISGEPLVSMLKSLRVDEQSQQELLTTYDRKVSKLHRRLQDQDPLVGELYNVQGRMRTMIYFTQGGYDGVSKVHFIRTRLGEYTLKSDNIIVDKQGQLWLIDPI